MQSKFWEFNYLDFNFHIRIRIQRFAYNDFLFHSLLKFLVWKRTSLNHQVFSNVTFEMLLLVLVSAGLKMFSNTKFFNQEILVKGLQTLNAVQVETLIVDFGIHKLIDS